MATLKPAGRRFKLAWRFRLRTLLLLFSAIAVPCAWEADRLHRRARAIALLNRWELWVNEEPVHDRLPWSLLPDSTSSWDLPWPSKCNSLSFVPGWVNDTADGWAEFDERLKHPRSGHASLRERKQLVAAIAALTELEEIILPFELDDDDLRSLSCLSEVAILEFKTSGLTGAAVGSLLRLRSLQGVVIDFDSPECVSVDAIARLGDLPGLLQVSLAHLPRAMAERIREALPGVQVDIAAPPD